jgi:hypothetical protein
VIKEKGKLKFWRTYARKNIANFAQGNGMGKKEK